MCGCVDVCVRGREGARVRPRVSVHGWEATMMRAGVGGTSAYTGEHGAFVKVKVEVKVKVKVKVR